jgi:WD40 repeat protein
MEGRLYVVRLDEGPPPRELEGFSERTKLWAVALSEDGRFAASAPRVGTRDEKVVRVWDLETGAVRAFGPLPGAGEGRAGGISGLCFLGRERLLAAVWGTGIVSVDLSSGTIRVVAAQPDDDFCVSRDGRFGVGMNRLLEGSRRAPTPLVRFDIVAGAAQSLPAHGTDVTAVALDPGDALVATGSADGTIRIGRVSGEEPHVLLGHEGPVNSVAFSPDGRTLASAGEDSTIRLWPVPDLSKPPLHRRPHVELLAVLRTHTNLRAVADPGSATGYKLEPGPFPGWARMPEW